MTHKLSTLTLFVALALPTTFAAAALAITPGTTPTINCPQKDAITAEIVALTKQLNDTKTRSTSEINTLTSKKAAALASMLSIADGIKSATNTAFSMKISAEIQKQWVMLEPQCPKPLGSTSSLNTCLIAKVLPTVTNAQAMLNSAQSGIVSILQVTETSKTRKLSDYTIAKQSLVDRLAMAKRDVAKMEDTRAQIMRDAATVEAQTMFNSDYASLMNQIKSGLNNPISIRSNFELANSSALLKVADLENQIKALDYARQLEVATQEKTIAAYNALLAQVTLDKNKLATITPTSLSSYVKGSQSAIYEAQKVKVVTGTRTTPPLMSTLTIAYDTWKKLGYDLQFAQNRAATEIADLVNRINALDKNRMTVMCPLAGGVPLIPNTITIK